MVRSQFLPCASQMAALLAAACKCCALLFEVLKIIQCCSFCEDEKYLSCF